MMSVHPQEPQSTIVNFDVHFERRFLNTSIGDWLADLEEHNEKGLQLLQPSFTTEIDKQQHSTALFRFQSLKVIIIAAKWCKTLKLPVPILLRTVELFEHFSEKYIHQLIKTRNSSSRTFLPPTSYMTDFRKEVAHKTLLHLMSCLQITSKLDDTYLRVTIDQAKHLLSQSKQSFHPSTIVQSEIKVLLALKHKVNYPPLSDYIDILICKLALVHKQASAAPLNSASRRLLAVMTDIHRISMRIVRMILFNQLTIMQQITSNLHADLQPNSREFNEKLRWVHRNKLLLAAGIISTATILVDQKSGSNMMRELQLHTKIEPDTMAIISTILLTFFYPQT